MTLRTGSASGLEAWPIIRSFTPPGRTIRRTSCARSGGRIPPMITSRHCVRRSTVGASAMREHGEFEVRTDRVAEAPPSFWN